MGEAGDRVDDHGPPQSGFKVAGLASDLDDLRGVGEAEVAHGDGPEDAQLHPAVSAVAGAVQHGNVAPGQPLTAAQQRGLVGLDGEQVVGLLAGHQELGGARVGVQRVGGDHHAGKVQAGQQPLEAGDLARGAVDRALGQHRTGGVVHRGQQVNLPAIVAFGAAQGLAVDRHRPPPMPLGWMAWVVAVGEPGSEHRRQRGWVHAGKRPADGGLGRHDPPAGAVAAGAERSRTGWGVSVAHSAIAVTDWAPATTAAAAMARIVASGWRRPLARLGSWMVAR
jgi:hypothetical protein